MVASSTLLVRHMPSELTSEEKEDFLKHFGAKSVKTFGSKNTKSNNVFATFETHSAAKAALQQLHQTELLGQLLAVEFARGEHIFNTNNASIQDDKKVCTDDSKEKKTRKYYENFLYRLSSWTTGIDFNIPPPVHLKYQYPPPSRNTIQNIAKALATVPKFYTQVLHLMNKMNLPCPFTDSFPIKSDILENKIVKEIEDYSDPSQRILTDIVHAKETSSEEESEMDSGDDESKSKLNEIIPSKRKIPEKKRKVKRPKFIKPVVPYTTQVSSKSVLKAEEVFEVTDKEPQSRKIEVKITPDLISIQEAEETQKSADTVEGFEKLLANAVSLDESERKGNSSAEEEENVGTCITEHELCANRISTRDQRILPVFNSYQPGAPSCRLYIKNLAKQVQTRDLHYIFRRYYVPDQEEQGTMFDVRLMQEGRMKGQAFINLQSVELAQKALKETNGFILKDKPMVVQFARSSKAK